MGFVVEMLSFRSNIPGTPKLPPPPPSLLQHNLYNKQCSMLLYIYHLPPSRRSHRLLYIHHLSRGHHFLSDINQFSSFPKHACTPFFHAFQNIPHLSPPCLSPSSPHPSPHPLPLPPHPSLSSSLVVAPNPNFAQPTLTQNTVSIVARIPNPTTTTVFATRFAPRSLRLKDG